MFLRLSTVILLLYVFNFSTLLAEQAVRFPFSQSSEPELSAFTDKPVHGSRLKTGGSQLSMGVEIFFLVPLSPSATLKEFKKISAPSGAGATDSFGIHNKARIHNPARIADFSRFKLSGKEGRFGIGGSDMRTLKKKNLNLSNTEFVKLNKAKADGDDRLEFAWKELFVARTKDFQNGGYLSYTPYETSSKPFHHRTELVTLLLSTPKILKNFQELIGAFMTGKPPQKADPPQFSWESSKVQGEETISLMCMISAPHKNGRIQIVETSYYVTGNYYTALTLYELVPVYDKKSGKTRTLVWRGDYVITESIGFLRGIERIAAENIMLQEVMASAKGFLVSTSN